MQRMIRYSFLIFFLLNLCDAFGQDSVYYITPKQTKIDVKASVPFIIRLLSCHSCGYYWTLESPDTNNIKFIGVRYQRVSGRDTDSGFDASEFWKFVGLKVGTYSFEFVNKRPANYLPEKGRCKFELNIN
jgi:predicted secreted protein